MVHLERLAIAVVLLTFAFGGYFWIGLSVDPASAATLATPLDARIPFIPESLYVYVSVYLLITLPIFVIDSPALFRRTAVAYGAIVAVCLFCFRFFPVSGLELRPDLTTVDASPFLLWGLHLNYGLDPPVNLFPSLHLAGATIASLAAWRAHRGYGLVGAAAVAAVAVSVTTVKQHFWVDALAGVVLAGVSYAVFLHRFELPPGERAARGPVWFGGFAALLLSAYALMYALYRAGFQPPGL